MIGTPELVFFGIQAAVKLARTGRRIYVENTAGRELIIPLPAGLTSLPANARQHAEKLARDPGTKQRFQEVFQKSYEASLAGEAGPARTNAEMQLVQLYLVDLRRGWVPGSKRAEQELAGIAALRQWAEGDDPFPHPLQRVAGTLAEVAVDYFVQVPGAINEHSRSGKTLKAFLLGLDEFDFEETRWDSILIGLFTAGLDFIQENPHLLADEAPEQGLVRTIVGGVAADLKERLQKEAGPGDLDADARLGRYGQIVLRSLLRNAGEVVVDDPTLLGVRGEGEKVLVQEAGSAFLSLLLDPGADDSFRDTMQRLASTPALDKLMQAALKAVVEHPDYFRTGDRRLDPWLRNVLADLHKAHGSGRTFLDPTSFAEVACLVMKHALRDLPAFKMDQPLFLITLVREVFAAIALPPATTQRTLSRTDLRHLFEAVLGAATAHPEWILELPANQALAATALPRLVEALARMEGGTLQALIRGGQFQNILAAVLVSGLAGKMHSVKTENLCAVLRLVWSEMFANGLAGLDALVSSHRLTDLLNALARSKSADKLFADDEKARRKAVLSVVQIVQELRAGSVLSVPAMVQKLNKSAAAPADA